MITSQQISLPQAPQIGHPPIPLIHRAGVRRGRSPAIGPVKSPFCGVETVSCVAGLSLDQIYEMVDRGRYLWVWDISVGYGSKRALRFWSREINDPISAAKLKLDAVIGIAIPFRAHISGQYDGLRAWEFRDLLRISKPCLHAMRHELGVCGTTRNLFIPRASIEEFFRKRWVGKLYRHKRRSARYKTPNYIPKT
jgi:hypothetical protein